ncbi:uncharacterized protein LOC130674399 [Microplitis mediator]|uniref:uncharacterized protein LOC130674399 n=1 Tax=Microplitis mediator TaxID=375433 RepID=UPI002553395D|nr:uncharacterized protein LOC130674399 [Microplitis mediator]
MVPSSKLVIISNLFIIVSLLIIEGEGKQPVPLKDVAIGATVNRQNTDRNTAKVLGNIINDREKYPDIYKKLTEVIHYPPKWGMRQFICSEPLDSVLDPAVHTDNFYFNNKNEKNRVFKSFEADSIKRGAFNIDNKYLNTNYTCILFELCNIKEERIKENVKVINEEDLPAKRSDIHYFGNLTAIVRAKRDSETHYVSSISKGNCLAQIYIYETEIAKESKQHLINYPSKNPTFTGPLISATNNTKLETWTKEYLEKLQTSLLKFESFQPKNQSDIFDHMESDAVRDFELIKLPELPDKLAKPDKEVKPDKVVKPDKALTAKKWAQLVPGDTFDITQFKFDEAVIISSLPRADPVEMEYFPESDEDYQKVTLRTIVDSEKSASKCPFEKLNSRDSSHLDDHEGLEAFECNLEKKDFGISKEYRNEKYKRVEVRICRTVGKLALPESMTIINWDKKFEDIGYNVLIDENVVLRYPVAGETHYVSAVYYGDCLYQALVYNVDKLETTKPVHVGKILSASNNEDLIKSINGLLKTSDTPAVGLYQIETNPKMRAEVIKKLDNSVVLSVNMRSLYAKLPPPQADLSQYKSFGNSLQASLITIIAIIVVAQFFTN